MGLFNTLMSKIFSYASSTEASAAAAPTSQPETPQASAAPAMPTSNTPANPAPTAASAPAQSVDVAAVLDKLAAKNSEKLDWKHSIVDLMKLVGMDSSLAARKELAHDLHYSGDTNDSAAMNTWLHKEVMQKLAANGAKIPQDLLGK